MSYWKHKLLAYLHDSYHMPASIKGLEEPGQTFLASIGLTAEEIKAFDSSADGQAAAADSVIFPASEKSGLRADWKQSWMEFRHPLGGGRLQAGSFSPASNELGTELDRILAKTRTATQSDEWQNKFILAWRLWPELAARKKNPHFAYWVADTRIPDHTLWQHNSLAAAFSSCQGQSGFLLFQIGPVQEFLAQARKTQDLWSGSYLLSYLIAQAMLAVANRIGPDSIVFPQLRGLPLADLHWWEKGYFGDLKLRASHQNELLTPNLPNRFLALVPANQGEELAQVARNAVVETWNEIAQRVKVYLTSCLHGKCDGWDKHWKAQIARFPVVDWMVHQWTDTETAIKWAASNTPPLHGGWKRHPLYFAQQWAKTFIPPNHRDSIEPHSNPAFAWALHYATTDWKFAARKNARSFDPWQPVGPLEIDGVPKDHLDGKNEVLGGTDNKLFWQMLRTSCPHQFRGSQLYGALSIIKRLWPEVYLPGALDLESKAKVFKPVDAIAQIDRAIDSDTEEEANIYYAILAMDGDDMGQWISGEKAAPLLNSLADESQQYFRDHWNAKDTDLPTDQVKRPLSPGYHAAISEALSNFSLYCALPIVSAFDGQLIYAGGDDVLAMVPATKALDCAQALQLAFRGVHPQASDALASEESKRVLMDLFDYSRHVIGFLTLNKTGQKSVGHKEYLKPNWPLMMMGPLATVSVGIAIGHVHSPMQDTIQAARDAERTAKSVSGKGAFAIEVLKRSGDQVGFAARWQANVAAIWGELLNGYHNQSGGFAHHYSARVKDQVIIGGGPKGARYAESWDETLKESMEAELRHVLQRQAECSKLKARELAERWCAQLTEALSPRDFLHFWLAWAFVNRIENTEKQD
jgi:CRISPR-associated protein Cmr2